MAAGFDLAALSYDTDFTNSKIGALQRARVYAHLDGLLKNRRYGTVLELGCGTGTDAQWFSQRGFAVTATDASSGMIGEARAKNIPNANFIQATFAEAGEKAAGKYDLVFSNFGALNCADPFELKTICNNARSLLKPGGLFVVVVMPRDTAWERLYFKLRPDKAAWNRRRDNAVANVPGATVSVWYYDPAEFTSIASGFDKVVLRPIGLFVPPSYLENVTGIRQMLPILSALESATTHIQALARYSDHYLLALRPQ